jgi:hypothetical protein
VKADDEDWFWCRWTPHTAESRGFEDVTRAVKKFRSLDNPPGREATRWLKEEALANHPATVSWVLMGDGRIEGYFAVASTSVELKQSHRKALSSGQRDQRLTPTQGATLVAWLARHEEAELDGALLLKFALSVARRAAFWQGTVALALDPFDETLAKLWVERYEFMQSRTRVRGDRLWRLWTPLYPR